MNFVLFFFASLFQIIYVITDLTGETDIEVGQPESISYVWAKLFKQPFVIFTYKRVNLSASSTQTQVFEVIPNRIIRSLGVEVNIWRQWVVLQSH